MTRYENRCVGCEAPGYPCRGASCPNRRVLVHYCDHCREEVDSVHERGGMEYCEDCMRELFSWGEE